MTAPEVMNSPSAVDAAIDRSQPVGHLNLQMVIARTLDQLRQLTRQREEIAQRIALIKRTVNGLALLYGAELQPKPEDGATAERRRGISSACRGVLNRADRALSARDVFAILQGEFPDLVRQPGNRYAALITILNRLVKYGEADTFLRNGSRFWQRHRSDDH